MTTIAIIGAGPGLGQATARRFGRGRYSADETGDAFDKIVALSVDAGCTAQ